MRGKSIVDFITLIWFVIQKKLKTSCSDDFDITKTEKNTTTSDFNHMNTFTSRMLNCISIFYIRTIR